MLVFITHALFERGIRLTDSAETFFNIFLGIAIRHRNVNGSTSTENTELICVDGFSLWCHAISLHANLLHNFHWRYALVVLLIGLTHLTVKMARKAVQCPYTCTTSIYVCMHKQWFADGSRSCALMHASTPVLAYRCWWFYYGMQSLCANWTCQTTWSTLSFCYLHAKKRSWPNYNDCRTKVCVSV